MNITLVFEGHAFRWSVIAPEKRFWVGYDFWQNEKLLLAVIFNDVLDAPDHAILVAEFLEFCWVEY